MNVLVLNCGSSSLKYQFINTKTEEVIAIGLCERIAIDGTHIYEANGEKIVSNKPLNDHKDAIGDVIKSLLDPKTGVIKSTKEISAVGHRVVHGGEFFTQSVIITEEVKDAIKECMDLAPLHNPANLLGIEVCEELIEGVRQVAVFDTAFHQTMPKKAYLYSIPYELYEDHKIRKYGFHGTSHLYVSNKAAEFLNKSIEDLKIISCHLGNGASVCAIDGGKSIDTSMGLTPLEGLTMGTRSGDIDPAVISFIKNKEKLTSKEVENMLNKGSGVLGISGVSSDFRDIEREEANGNERAKIALDIFHYKVAKYIGAYAAALNGVDVIIFTAGLGENGKNSRMKICDYLGYLGVDACKVRNDIRGEITDFSKDSAKVKTLIIPTNEELVIARDTKKLLDK